MRSPTTPPSWGRSGWLCSSSSASCWQPLAVKPSTTMNRVNLCATRSSPGVRTCAMTRLHHCHMFDSGSFRWAVCPISSYSDSLVMVMSSVQHTCFCFCCAGDSDHHPDHHVPGLCHAQDCQNGWQRVPASSDPEEEDAHRQPRGSSRLRGGRRQRRGRPDDRWRDRTRQAWQSRQK